ncbi:MAG: protease SohB [Gammaproteobacteria bacterium]|nr:protease SohB [Gammaproteobacteria bacterium]MBT7369908.1 protease SohB [Gammaproteobacteria bacterium]
MEFLFEYGLFFAKSVTVLVAILVVIAFVFGANQRHRDPEVGHIEVRNLNDSLAEITNSLKAVVLHPEARKQDVKDEKKRAKQKQKAEKQEVKAGADSRLRLFVLDFKGDIQASEVTNLREEITAVLSVAGEGDEVLVRLESPGGVVHGYGLAASQLQRIRNRGVSLTVAVDKVAASGGYMMACIANKLIAAPFAILGSIGVVAQLPNFHRLLKKNEIDFEVLTAGEYKRTLTVFGENTDKAREKFVDDLEDVHRLFKDFVSDHRPSVEIEEVATGEAWFGTRALDRKLVDELKTSDEYLVDRCDEMDVFQVRYVLHKHKLDVLMDKVTRLMSPVSTRQAIPTELIQ